MFEAAIRVLRKHDLLAELAEEMIADHDYGSAAIPEQARDGTPAPRTRRKLADVAPKPHKIPGTGETHESWAGKYCDMLRTSADFEVVREWMDKNQQPLEGLRKFKPSVAQLVRKVTTDTLQDIEDAQKMADARAARKAAAQPTEMDDASGEGGLGPDTAVIDGRSGEGTPQDLPLCQTDGETAGTALHS